MGGILAAAAALGGLGVSVTVSPPIASGSGTTSTGSVPAVTAIPAGGNGTYSFAWVVVEEDPFCPLTINFPSAPETGFTFTGIAAGMHAYAIVRVTVTNGLQTASADVTVTYQDRRREAAL